MKVKFKEAFELRDDAYPTRPVIARFSAGFETFAHPWGDDHVLVYLPTRGQNGIIPRRVLEVEDAAQT